MEAVNLDVIKEIINTIGNAEEIGGMDNAETTDGSTLPENGAGEQTEDTAYADDGTVWQRIRRYFRYRYLYRDPDNCLLGGVCSGIAHYLGFGDPVLWRLLMVLMFFLQGSGLIAYILLWLIIPLARTPEDKLRMKRNKAQPRQHQPADTAGAHQQRKLQRGKQKQYRLGMSQGHPGPDIAASTVSPAHLPDHRIGGIRCHRQRRHRPHRQYVSHIHYGQRRPVVLGHSLHRHHHRPVYLRSHTPVVQWPHIVETTYKMDIDYHSRAVPAVGRVLHFILHHQDIFHQGEPGWNTGCARGQKQGPNQDRHPLPDRNTVHHREEQYSSLYLGGDYPTGDGEKRYLDASNYKGDLIFTATKGQSVTPGVYDLYVLARAEDEGAFIYAETHGVWKMTEIPEEGNQHGNLWSWACGKDSLDFMKEAYPALCTDSVRQQIASANEGKGFGWSVVKVGSIETDKNYGFITYGITTDPSITKKQADCDWVSATDFVLVQTKKY